MSRKIEAVIFDWAGTTVDYGCFAPVQAFITAFEEYGITPTFDEVREPMGMLKRDHIRTMMNMERIHEEWKRVHGKDFTEEDWKYAQQHLFITSFLYGLLRPLDLIKIYLLEGDVRMPEHGEITMFEYWRTLLTEYFITEIKKQGNLLINLASAEMKDLFHWKEVTRAVEDVTPEFMVYKNGKPTTVVIYAKMCRGEMTRFILKNRIEDIESLKSFEWEGFTFDEALSQDNRLIFTLK